MGGKGKGGGGGGGGGASDAGATGSKKQQHPQQQEEGGGGRRPVSLNSPGGTSAFELHVMAGETRRREWTDLI